MHKRRAILEDLKAQLKNLPGYGGVWIQRSAPNRNAFPAITLFSESENIDTLTIHGAPRPQQRTLQVSVMVWIQSVQDEEKTEINFDKAAIDIEQKLTRPAGVDDMILLGTEFSFVEDDMEINAVTLIYKISYITIEYNPI